MYICYDLIAVRIVGFSGVQEGIRAVPLICIHVMILVQSR
jgi:hypothetical protein